MKRTLFIFTIVAVASAMTISCGNNKQSEPSQEEIQALKNALSDSVLTAIDEIAEQYFDARSNSFIFRSLNISDDEKLVLPDYLMDLSVVSTLVTREQKVNALGILISDIGVRMLYGMPTEETQEAIAKLCAETNLAIDSKPTEYQLNVSEKIKETYSECKDRNDISSFWRFQSAAILEISYILAQNPEFYFSKISEEQFQAYVRQTKLRREALELLSKYDQEMAEVYQLYIKSKPFASDKDMANINASKEANIQYRKANKESIIARRNALLQ